MQDPVQQRADIIKYIDRCEAQIRELQKEIQFKKKYVKLLDREIDERKESTAEALQEITANLK